MARTSSVQKGVGLVEEFVNFMQEANNIDTTPIKEVHLLIMTKWRWKYAKSVVKRITLP